MTAKLLERAKCVVLTPATSPMPREPCIAKITDEASLMSELAGAKQKSEDQVREMGAVAPHVDFL